MRAADRIPWFLRRQRRRNGRYRIARAAVAHATATACLAAPAVFLWPARGSTILAAAGAWTLLASLRAALRGWSGSLVRMDRELGLEDRLATWPRAREAPPEWRDWLAEDLDRALGGLPRERLEAHRGRRWGVRWALLLVALLLLGLSWFLPGLNTDTSRPRPSVAEGGVDRVMPSTGDGAGPGPAEPPPARPSPPPSGRQGPAESEPAEPGPEPPQEHRTGPEESAPPEPLPEDLGTRDEFAVPSFVGDAETRRQRVHQAWIEEFGAAGSRGGGGAGKALPTDDRARARAYRAAYEKALRSRHVPDHERPTVRRWFETLRRRGGEDGR